MYLRTLSKAGHLKWFPNKRKASTRGSFQSPLGRVVNKEWQIWIKYSTGDPGIGIKMSPSHTWLSSCGSFCLKYCSLPLFKDIFFTFSFKTLLRHLLFCKTCLKPLPPAEIGVVHLCSYSTPCLFSSAIASTALYHNFMHIDKFPLISGNLLEGKVCHLSIWVVCNKCLSNWTELGRMSLPRFDLASSLVFKFNVNLYQIIISCSAMNSLIFP